MLSEMTPSKQSINLCTVSKQHNMCRIKNAGEETRECLNQTQMNHCYSSKENEGLVYKDKIVQRGHACFPESGVSLK